MCPKWFINIDTLFFESFCNVFLSLQFGSNLNEAQDGGEGVGRSVTGPGLV